MGESRQTRSPYRDHTTHAEKSLDTVTVFLETAARSVVALKKASLPTIGTLPFVPFKAVPSLPFVAWIFSSRRLQST